MSAISEQTIEYDGAVEKKPRKVSLKLVLFKIAITVGLLLFLFNKVGLEGVAVYLKTADPVVIGLAGILLLTQVVSSTLAWSVCLRFCWGPVSRLKLLRITAIGLLFNQVLPASIGGIASRTIMLTRDGVKLNASLASIFLERFTNLLSLAVLGALGFLLAFHALSKDAAFNTMVNGGIAVVLLTMVFGFLRMSKIINSLPDAGILSKVKRALRKIRDFTQDRRSFIAAMAFGFWWNLASVVAMYFFAAAAIVDVAFVPFVSIAAICVMFAAIPISVSGWGVRESVMVALMPFAGITQEQAFAISIVFGGVLVLTRLPALILLWLPKDKK